jgi:hypothetical protein
LLWAFVATARDGFANREIGKLLMSKTPDRR